jgi:hypothetical protein
MRFLKYKDIASREKKFRLFFVVSFHGISGRYLHV